MKKTKRKKIITSKWEKIDQCRVKVDFIQWYTCPHCEKTVMMGDVEAIGALKQWHLERTKAERKTPKKKSKSRTLKSKR